MNRRPKATYAVTFVVDERLTALSNMRAVSEKAENGLKTVKFAPTPRMSTYLLAWCIGEFESSEPALANGKELRIWSVPGKNALKGYALKCAAYGVQWYERTLGVPYFGGDKIDMIAIPEFRSGAMENTGLITYRATALLVDEPHATVAELQRAAEVVFHELAHMWFGNLVTMAWWDGLPLNESNATIFAYLVMEDFQPEWRSSTPSPSTGQRHLRWIPSTPRTRAGRPSGIPTKWSSGSTRSRMRKAAASSTRSTSSWVTLLSTKACTPTSCATATAIPRSLICGTASRRACSKPVSTCPCGRSWTRGSSRTAIPL